MKDRKHGENENDQRKAISAQGMKSAILCLCVPIDQ